MPNPPQPSLNGLFEPASWEFDALVESMAEYVCSGRAERFVENHADSLSALTPAGFERLIGLYVDYAIANPRSDAAIRFALHIESADDSAYWRERHARFSPEQWSRLRAVAGLVLEGPATE